MTLTDVLIDAPIRSGRRGPTRVDGPLKVTGRARFALDHPLDDLAHVWLVPATIAKGEVLAIDATAARALPGVLAVIDASNCPPLVPFTDDRELDVFQSPIVSYRGQIVAAVVASSLEVARDAAARVAVDYRVEDHDVSLRDDHPGLFSPDGLEDLVADSVIGDVDAAIAAAPVVASQTYTTPSGHNHPMEPHATIAVWQGDQLTLFDATQGPPDAQRIVAAVLGIDPAQVRIIADHVGGGFGAKGLPRLNAVIAAVAARLVDRPVACAVPRRMMPALTGHRTPTVQHLTLAADPDGHLSAVTHDVFEQTSTVRDFAEGTASVTRRMYRGPNRRTTHRLVRLDVPSPSWFRAPGDCPGSFALESAIDELAAATGVDPVELRIRNDPDTEPETGTAYTHRNLVACLREGANRFGWEDRDPTPGVRRQGRWLVGTGVAASAYPSFVQASQARATALADGRFEVAIAAIDVGNGSRTALTIAAAEALGLPADRLDLVDLRLGDSDLPDAPLAGGSWGTASWGWAVVEACRALAEEPTVGRSVTVDTTEAVAALPDRARSAFGAQFVEAWVDVDSGEVRVPRMLGVFAAGRILSPRTARSQLIGGMTMGLSMALFEEATIDPVAGDFVQRDLAGYHIAAHADVRDIDAVWIDEQEPDFGPLGTKGIGEIGIVGAAAAVANAVFHATGIRVRDLPIRLDRLLR